MAQQLWSKKRVVLTGVCGVVALTLLVMWGCCTNDTTVSVLVATRTATALIDAPTLKGWADAGLVNSKSGERVVILDITESKDYYDRGHIPGAIYVDPAEIVQTRIEGAAASSTMVADGSKMDALIQRCGIDKNTTIVFTASSFDPVYNPTRAYATFRYWGFPKERLKVLDGWDNGWKAVYALTSVTPTIARSKYGIALNGKNRIQAGLRVSLGEMIATVRNYDATKHAIIDTRSIAASGAYAGTPGTSLGVFSPNAGTPAVPADYTVFEGHMKHAKALVYTSLYNKDNANRFFPADDGTVTSLKSRFAVVGMDATKTAYVYCRTGYMASSEFFVLDGILGWNAVWYDGSWSQWGQMSSHTANGGKLPASAVWATDVPELSEIVVYNFGKTVTISGKPALLTINYIEALPVDPISARLFTTTSDPRANQIENEDVAYKSPAASSSTSSASPSKSSGGC
ncbi:MAG: sulfurtransferase [Verrucomicrobia bacterium]|nr:sulfurtransferase [Deltaproteobacteria bacterium]